MISEKLTSLLGRFSKYDLNRFRKFLLSPYFNDQDDVVQLFELCNAAFRQGNETASALTKTAIWNRLYPGRPLDDAHLRRLTSELTQLAIRFIGLEKQARTPVSELINQHLALDEPGLTKHRAGIERLLDRYWEQQGERSGDYYYSRFRLAMHNSNRASITMFGPGFINELADADFYFECYYIVQKLKIYTAWLTFRGLRSTESELIISPGFFNHIAQPRFQQEPLIEIYRLVVRCLTEPEDETFFRQLVDSLGRHGAALSHDDLRECYWMAQNYCAFKINQGKTNYYREMFEIFRRTIEENILLENGQLPEGVFKNIVTVSLVVGEFAWAEHFIQQYAGFLPMAIRDNARTFNLASLYFYQKQYAKVIELLRGVEYSDVVYALGAKVLLLRTYFESDEQLALDSLIDSFRIYLRRNKVISKELKREYTNFINFLKRLSLLKGSAPADVAALKKRVLDSQFVTAKKWLLEKIDELQTA